jgi:hypothetical protein
MSETAGLAQHAAAIGKSIAPIAETNRMISSRPGTRLLNLMWVKYPCNLTG